MAMPKEALNLELFDGDVRRAAGRLEQLRGWLALGTADARDKARSFDPFEGLRHTATMSSYVALSELEPSAVDVPLRDGLLRWVHELLQARVGLDLAIADADAARAFDPRMPASRLDAAQKAADAREARLLSPAEADGGAHTYADAIEAMIAAPDPSRAAAGLERAAELAAPVAAVRKERRARRFEASRRLGLAHPLALATKIDVAATARALLDATEPLAVDLLRRARKGEPARWRASSAVQLWLGRAARDGWPSHLTQRWLDGAFKALAPRGVPVGPLPAPLGGASFLRAAVSWGYAWRTASAPRSMPFGLARDPYPAPAFRVGFALASAVASVPFQRRVLELPSRLAGAQARVLRESMLHHARTLAARALLACEERVTASLFEEIGARLFGAPPPAALREAWPEPRVTDGSRLVAALGARALSVALDGRFDEDWYRNPKAGVHLTSLACGPAFDAEPLAEDAVAALGRAFEEALG